MIANTDLISQIPEIVDAVTLRSLSEEFLYHIYTTIIVCFLVMKYIAI